MSEKEMEGIVTPRRFRYELAVKFDQRRSRSKLYQMDDDAERKDRNPLLYTTQSRH